MIREDLWLQCPDPEDDPPTNPPELEPDPDNDPEPGLPDVR